ncbi:type III effector, partial [Pseudomonas syringae pv. tagetis]
DTFAKAEKLDRMATLSSSALRATRFAAASMLQYMQPAFNKGDWLPTPLIPLAPLISVALSGAMDQVGSGVMNRATGDLHY